MRAVSIFTAVFALTLVGCDPQPAETITVRIDHYQEPCGEQTPAFCLRVLESSDPEIPAATSIEGFEYEWGHIYEVVASAHPLPTDEQTAYEFELVEVLDEQVVDPESRFSLRLSADHLARVDNVQFKLLNDLSASCLTTTVCSIIAEAMRHDAEFDVELTHPERPGGAFVAHSAAIASGTP
jgi:hypothetical protein